MAPRLIAILALCSSPAFAANHFILELEGGFARPLGVEAESDFGSAFGGTFGFGGRIPGFAPAYYLVGRVAHSGFSYQGAARVGRPDIEHGETEVAVGTRMYLPITRKLRLLFQIAVGETYGEMVVSRDGDADLTVETETFTVFGEVGLQYRLNNHFSLGGVVDASYLPDREDFNVVRTAAGVDDSGYGRLRLALTTTFHF